MTQRTLLLDGDISAYRYSATAEQPTNWGDGIWTLHAQEGPAITALMDHLDTL